MPEVPLDPLGSLTCAHPILGSSEDRRGGAGRGCDFPGLSTAGSGSHFPSGSFSPSVIQSFSHSANIPPAQGFAVTLDPGGAKSPIQSLCFERQWPAWACWGSLGLLNLRTFLIYQFWKPLGLHICTSPYFSSSTKTEQPPRLTVQELSMSSAFWFHKAVVRKGLGSLSPSQGHTPHPHGRINIQTPGPRASTAGFTCSPPGFQVSGFGRASGGAPPA